MKGKRFHPLVLLFSVVALLVLAWATNASAQEPDPEKLSEGAQLYAENCAVCHGDDGQGRVGAMLNKDWPAINPNLLVRDIIENGIPGSVMPAWSMEKGGPFTVEQIDALVYFILSWQSGGAPQVTPWSTATPLPPVTPVPNVEGDPNRGAQLFAENCVVCHGPRGQGRIGANLGKDWSGIRPDLSVLSVISNGLPGSVMPAWSQARGGPLTDTDIQDLTAYVLALPGSEFVPADTAPEAFVPSWLAGWGGVLLLVVLLAVIIFGALFYQKRFPPKQE
jgi:mono/diheme cytochrome c family protein